MGLDSKFFVVPIELAVQWPKIAIDLGFSIQTTDSQIPNVKNGIIIDKNSSLSIGVAPYTKMVRTSQGILKIKNDECFLFIFYKKSYFNKSKSNVYFANKFINNFESFIKKC